MAHIEIQDVAKRFVRGRNQEHVDALSDVNLTVEHGEIVSIVGPSGCGKTTLLNVIAGLTPPTRGRTFVGGKAVDGPGKDRGVVFQQDALFLWRNVRRNVEYGLEIQGIPRADRRATALRWLRLVGLEAFAEFWPKELSGGMKKRCQMAVVLANDPDVLLMDEPFGALDYMTKCELQNELLHILDGQPKTVVFVTHDIEEAAFLADRVIVMRRGQIAETCRIPFERPRTAALRLSLDFARVRQELMDVIESPGSRLAGGGEADERP